MIYAFKGEVVTCERGHPVAQFNRDVARYDVSTPDTLTFADGSKPRSGEAVTQCRCGALAFQMEGGLVAFIGGQWRRSQPDNPLDGTRLWDNS